MTDDFAGKRAEALVDELGITSPEDLEVEAIAFDSGVEVIYERLSGCEATLVGYGNRAIATVNPSAVRGRKRFSVAHELGHWHLHRGRSFQCRVDEPDANLAPERPLEREADTFAAHLLMPGVLFKPLIRQLGQPDFSHLAEVAGTFDTSLMATALRLVGVNTLPVVVALYDRRGRCWGFAAADVPARWFLRRDLDEDTFTYDLLHRGKECHRLGKQSADAWFENDDAEQYEVLEQCMSIRPGEALVLLYLQPEMLEAGFDWNVGNRRYTEHGSYVPKVRR